jgi:enamine deaminase RidA (YjgF/YER057c/UK114 family)
MNTLCKNNFSLTKNTIGLFDAYCLTITFSNDTNIEIELKNLINFLKEEKIQILFGFGFGINSKYPLVLDMFHAENIDPFPLTWIECIKHNNFEIDGIYLYGIKDCEIKRIKDGSQVIGSFFEDMYASYLYLGNITADNIKNNYSLQTETVFNKIDIYLKSFDMEMNNIIRTWFYNNDILSWYGNFNVVRTKCYNEKGIFNNLVPASTGIGGLNSKNSALISSLIAVKPKKNILIREVPSPLQGAATKYGSSFSRAVEIKTPASHWVTISGTASIDKIGHTIFQNDIENQISFTMDVISEILQQCDMSLENTTRAFVYLKKNTYKKDFLKYLNKIPYRSLPLIIINSTICRDDLLFECELDACKML